MIRRFSFFDIDEILDIERQAFPKSPYDRATFANLQWLYPETFFVYVNPSSQQGEGQIVGYIIFSKDGHIISIAVLPLWRRKGIGKQLLETVLQAPGLRRIWAEVRVRNQRAQAFYFSLGFQVIGVVPDYYGNEDALVIERNITNRDPRDSSR